MKKPLARHACLLITFLAAAHLHAQLPDEFRTWTNTSGKQIEATLLAVDSATRAVKLKMKDGQTYDVPIASLSPADFEYAKARYAAMQAAPPAPAAMPAAPAPAPAATPTTADTPPAEAKKEDGKAKGKPKAAPAAPAKPAPPRPVFTTLPLDKFKMPSSADILASVQKVRPRMIHNAASWAALKAQIAKAKLFENLKASGEEVLTDPELSRINGDTSEGNNEGSKAIYRVGLFGALHYCDGDPKWKERAVREVELFCDKINFRDWHPSEPSGVTDMVIAVSLGYDWFRDGFNTEKAAQIREFVYDKGVEALLAHLQDEPVPPVAFGVSAGGEDSAKKKEENAKKAKGKGKEPERPEEVPVNAEKMAIASALLIYAVSFADEAPDHAKKAANAAVKVFGEGWQRFAPAGVWPEGFGRGDAVLDYAAILIQSSLSRWHPAGWFCPHALVRPERFRSEFW
jgi:hypothetical protein